MRVVTALISLIACLAMSCTPARAQYGSIDSPYGVCVHMPATASEQACATTLANAGNDWIRIDFIWEWVETSQDYFDWGYYDSIANYARSFARPLRIFATIQRPPAWALDGSGRAGYIANVADLTDFVTRSVQRYSDVIQYWGVYNEPLYRSNWGGSGSEFINRILIPGADAVHAANPNAKFGGPELPDTDDWSDWLNDCLQQAGSKIDFVTQHAYSTTRTGLNNKLDSLYQVLRNASWTKPVWLTETGWDTNVVGLTGQRDRLNDFLNDWFTGIPGRDWINKVFFYEMRDDPNIYRKWGLLYADGSIKPNSGYGAYAGFVAAHPYGCSISGNVKDGNGANVLGVTVSTSPGGYSATTDAGGNYAIYLVAGAYTVTASKERYTSASQPVSIANGQVITADFTIARLTRVHGHVNDSSGVGIPGVTVSTNVGGYSATTDSSGYYDLGQMISGAYTLTASHTDYCPLSYTMSLSGGVTWTRDFRLYQSSLSGKATDSTGAGLAGATVSASPGTHTATTNASGEYTLTGFGPGTYTVSASRQYYDSASVSKTLVCGQTNTLDITLTGGPVKAATISEIKALPDDTAIRLVSARTAVVSSDQFAGGCIYIEEPDRSCGIKVMLPPGETVKGGRQLTLIGTLKTDYNSERYIDCDDID